AALSVVRAGPGIGGGERRRLLAAFNGGFLLSGGARRDGEEGHRIRPPPPPEAVGCVGQSRQPLVRRGHAARAAGDWTVWGSTLGGGEDVARSALGQNAAGQLIYAGGMST